MSSSRDDVQSHSPHWFADHSDKWIKSNNDEIHISSRAMNIIWGNDNRFWKWVELSDEESCFEVSAELIQVNYLEITGSVDITKHKLSPSKTYEFLYLVKFSVDAFGWHSSPIAFELTTPDGCTNKKSHILEPYRKRSHKLQEVHGGELHLLPNMVGKVVFQISECETKWWKGGIIFEGIIIRPKTE